MIDHEEDAKKNEASYCELLKLRILWDEINRLNRNNYMRISNLTHQA